MSINVENRINVYEIDGTETAGKTQQHLVVKSHWNLRNFIVLKWNGKEITVSARQIKQAIENAQNAHD